MIRITMENGKTIDLELDAKAAPLTVENFLKLVGEGFYDGLIFHRVIPGFMIQGGCPQGTGMGGPGYSIKGEFAHNGWQQNDIHHELGVLSMARAMHPDSAGSQFFIMVGEAGYLDGEYAAFGRLLEGMAAAQDISRVPRSMGNDRPKVQQVIRSIRVDTQGVEYPAPEKGADR